MSRYNPTAETSHDRLEALREDRLILRSSSPIDLPALFLICSKHHALTSWDSFLDFFGNPSIFLEMPGATDQAQAARFDAIVKKLIGEGRGTIPQGAQFHTVETQRDNSQAFADRARWCSDAILTLGTGGKLTIATEAGSGTLAGNAHQESFERLCAASARSISECINRQFCRRILRDAFPDSPQLAAFSLAPEKEDDRAAQAQIIATLSSAGFRPSAETVSELIGFEVQPVAPSQPATPFSPGLQPITNSATASPSEPNSDMVHRTWSMVHASDSEQEEPVENSECKSKYGESGCRIHGRGLRAAHKGSRATKGNPRAKTTQSNTPLKSTPAANPQAKVNAIDHALKSTQKGGKVEGVAKIGKKSLEIKSGKPGKGKEYEGGFGSTHQYLKHGDASSQQVSTRDAAKSLVLGEKEKDEHGVHSVRKKTISSFKDNGQNVSFTTSYKKDKPKP